jgi:hypothetical protein
VGLEPPYRREEHPAWRQSATERRILEYAGKHFAGKFTRIDLRFRGALCYIDVYTEPDLPGGIALPTGETCEQWMERLRNTPIHLCRIRYFGNEDRWSFAWYTHAHEKYEPSFLITGDEHGTPEEAFETSAQFF